MPGKPREARAAQSREALQQQGRKAQAPGRRNISAGVSAACRGCAIPAIRIAAGVPITGIPGRSGWAGTGQRLKLLSLKHEHGKQKCQNPGYCAYRRSELRQFTWTML